MRVLTNKIVSKFILKGFENLKDLADNPRQFGSI